MILWIITFVLRFFIDDNSINNNFSEQNIPSVILEISESLSINNKKKFFFILLLNNLKVCLYNIVGGVMLGLGTLVTLLINGFIVADTFIGIYKSGMPITDILNHTLPHSFEIIGVWLSGAIGFYIAWNIILFIRGKESFTSLAKIVYGRLLLLIILVAAFVEAYISTRI